MFSSLLEITRIQFELGFIIGKPNEVIVYRVRMYTNHLLNVQVVYSTFKGPSVYYSTWGISENNFFHLNINWFEIKKT